MPNEMRRPCTLWGETFDAVGVKAVNDYLTFEEESASPSMGYSCSVLIRDPFKGDIASPVYKNKIESYKAIAEAITTIANALNPPIKVTQAVLKAMEEVPEAKFWVWDDESKYLLEWQGVWEYESKNDSWQNGRDFDDEGIPSHSKLQLGDYIQADCPLALQVLFQFNTEGKLLCLTK